MKKFLIMILACLMMLSGCTKHKDEKRTSSSQAVTESSFSQYLNDVFIAYLKNSYVDGHFAVEDPSVYGVTYTKDDITWGHLMEEDTTKAELKALLAHESDEMTDVERAWYESYKMRLTKKQVLNDDRFDYLVNVCSPMNSQTNAIATTLVEFPFYKKQDIEDYITLMKSTKDYCQEIVDYLKKQSKKGYFMSEDTADEYLSSLKSFMNLKKSPVVAFFDKCTFDFELSDTERAAYRSQVKDAYDQYVYTGFDNVKKTVEKLKKTGKGSGGLAKKKNGKAYYQAYMQYMLGTELTVDQLYKKIEDRSDDDLTILMRLYMSKNIVDGLENAKTQYKSYEEILSYLKQTITKDFPEIKAVDYDVTDMDPSIAVSGTSAYYLIPPIDEAKNHIRVNHTSSHVDLTSPDLFSTLAHEGFPGHLYQNNYIRQKQYPAAISFCHTFDGYTEGYATFVQYKSYDYMGFNKDVAEGLRLNEKYSYLVVLLADIGIHYYGWSENKTLDFLVESGFGDYRSSVKPLYRQLLGDPGIFLSYHAGNMMFDNMKEKAQKSLGKSYDEKAFMELILTYGPISLDVLDQQVEAYLKSKS